MVKRKVFERSFLVLIGSILLSGCGKSGHMPLPTTSGGTVQGGAVEAQSYESIRSILQARCFRCHNAGPLNWGDKDTLLRVTRNGAFKNKLSTGLMPQKGSPEASEITASERQKLISWADSNNQVGVIAPPPAAETVGMVKDRNFAFVYQCMACHGQFGTSVSDQIPNLAGDGPIYINTRVQHFLSPTSQGLMADQIKRIVTEFTGPIKADASGQVELSPEAKDLIGFAATYFEQFQPGPSAAEFKTRRESLSAEQKSLYEKGQKLFAERCIACHTSVSLQPLPIAPMLFGQKMPYLIQRLNEFKTGTGGTMMPGIVTALSPEDLEAAQFYVANTHVTEVRGN